MKSKIYLCKLLTSIIILLGCVSNSLKAETVRLGVGRQLPPYVIDQTTEEFISRQKEAGEKYEGMELEIVREALKAMGHELEPVILPLVNVEEEIKSTGVAGFFPCDESIGIEGLFFSDSHISYQNVAISLKSSNLTINSVADLAGKKIAAFPNAKIYLGEEFKKIAESNPDYNEMPLRGQHLMSLFYDKTVDVIIMDLNIFSYYVSSISNYVRDSVQIHQIFPKNDYRVGFFNEQLRDDFNIGLKRITQTGKRDGIVQKYKKLIDGFTLAPQQVKIAFGTQLAPYVITDVDFMFTKLPPFVIPDEGAGMELEIVRAALKAVGKTLIPVYLPLVNVKKEMEENNVVGVSPCREEIGIPELKFSDSHITYFNRAITLKKKKLQINSINDLKGKRVVAFQNAKIYLGEEFANAIQQAKSYEEIPLRGRHTLSLFHDAADVILMDENIFKYRFPLFSSLATINDIMFHEIFEPNYYKVGFLDEKLRDEFNEGLKKIKRDGTYDKIIATYKAILDARVTGIAKK